MNKQINSLYRT